MRAAFTCLLAVFLAATQSCRLKADEIALNGHIITLPSGFEISVAAKPPVVDRPITASFDDIGRLYVADSSGSNDKVAKQLAERPHRILRLEDTDGDGTFDRHTVFADKMMFPEGTLWVEGSLFVSAPPSIWKLTDTNDDGVADRREEWLKQTLNGCANDLHGPYLGPDGWIYWCKGAFEQQTYSRPNGKPFVTKAAHIFRARPDGSGIEPVMTGGMDNPVDVTFTPGGERIFTTTFLVNPRGGQRDGLIHAIYGGVYGKEHGVIDGHPRTGELMPTLDHLGPAAPCGLARYTSAAFGNEYRDNLFACLFNMHKVTRHELTPRGATFQTKDHDFVLSNSLDFHPTDVVEDADGSLLIVDTGGWYKLCCPTSQLYKPDILGAIYRVRAKGAPRVSDPRGQSIDWDRAAPNDLASLLSDGRTAVRDRAMRNLAKKEESAIGPLAKALHENPSADVRRHAVWALTRIDHQRARATARSALTDRDEEVRQAAAHSAGLWRDREAVAPLIALLRQSSAQNRRAAAEALGRIGDRSAVPPLLDAAGQLGDDSKAASKELNYDRVLEHSLIFALIEIADTQTTIAALDSNQTWTQRAAMIAVDQMPGGKLSPTQTARRVAASATPIASAAAWIVDRHPEWGEALAGIMQARLFSPKLTPSERNELERPLSRFAINPAIQTLAAKALNEPSASREIKLCALRSLRQSALKNLPELLIPSLKNLLAGGDDALLPAGIAVVRALPPAKERVGEIAALLEQIAVDSKRDAALRLDALSALPVGLAKIDSPMFDFLRTHLGGELPVATRAAAADALAKSKLSLAQLDQLTESVRDAGPLEADRLLGCYEGVSDEKIGLKLIAALDSSTALTSLRVDSIRTRIAKQPPAVQKKAEPLYARINVDLAKQRQRIETLLPLVGHGDVRRGQLVFARAKSACASCHQFGYIGGNIGPDLTKIGGIRSERDLLESIMFPSSSFVRSFEPVQLITKEGKVLNGLVKSEAHDEIVLVASATETLRIARDDVEEMRPSTVSVMPAGLDQQLTPAELADLVAFLKNAR